GERKSDEYRVVERENRQQQDRHIKEREIEERVEAQSSAAMEFRAPHRILAAARRAAWTTSAASAPTAAMLVTASAAPSGPLSTRPNCTWMILAIITPSEPPTSVGVT